MAVPAQIWVGGSAVRAEDGSFDKPYASVYHAADWLGARRRQGDLRDLTVYLQPGIWQIPRPVVLTSADCPAGTRTIFCGADGGEVCLKGAVPCQSLPVLGNDPRITAASALVSKSLLAIDLPDQGCAHLDLGSFGFALPLPHPPPGLTIADRSLSIARWPAQGSLAGTVVDAAVLASVPGDAGGFAVEVEGSWSDIVDRDADLWVEMVVGQPWRWFQGRIRAIDPARRIIVTDLPMSIGQAGERVWAIRLINSWAGLRRGSFVLDRDARQAIVESDEISQDVPPGRGFEVTNNEAAIFHLDGACGVTFRNLSFSDVSGSGITGNGCQDIAVESCRFARLGTEAVGLSGYNIRIGDCRIQDVGTTGIRVSSGDIQTLRPGHSSVHDCSITRWANWNRVYEPAVRARGVGILIAGCVIEDGPHIAIDMSGNDHELRACVIGRVVRDFDDMGAVYVNQGETPLRRGISIVGNHFHDIGQAGDERHAIYIDRASSGISIRANVFIDIGREGANCHGIYANGASDLEIVENLFIDCPRPISISYYLLSWGHIDVPAMTKAWDATLAALSNPDLPHHARYPELANFPRENRFVPRSISAKRNLFGVTSQGIASFDPIAVKYAEKEAISLEDNALLGTTGITWSTHSTAFAGIADRSTPSVRDWLLEQRNVWPRLAGSIHGLE